MAKNSLTKFEEWHKTRSGYLSFGVVELTIAYGFASLAINYGSFWQYVLAIILLFGGIRNLVRTVRTPNHGQHKR